jgi:hypothetical protein
MSDDRLLPAIINLRNLLRTERFSLFNGFLHLPMLSWHRGEAVSVHEKSAVARIPKMAEKHHVAYVQTARDALARHITRLAGDDVQLDEIEQLLIVFAAEWSSLACQDGKAPGGLSARSPAVTFDPSGDFETQGYLRNLAREKDPEIVRHLEHASFMTGLDAALERLAKIERLSYSDLLETHRILFEAVYPWAGQDRHRTAPDLARRSALLRAVAERRGPLLAKLGWAYSLLELQKYATDKLFDPCQAVYPRSGS